MHLERDQIRTLIAVGALAAVFFFAGWLPERLHHARLQERIEAAERRLGFDQRDARGLPELAANVDRLRAIVDRTPKYVPETDEWHTLHSKLSVMLHEHDAQQIDLTTSESTRGEDFSTIPFSLDFEADFPSIFGVLSEIESMRRMIRVERIEITADRKDRTRPVEASFDMTTFSSVRLEGATP